MDIRTECVRDDGPTGCRRPPRGLRRLVFEALVYAAAALMWMADAVAGNDHDHDDDPPVYPPTGYHGHPYPPPPPPSSAWWLSGAAPALWSEIGR